MSRAWIAGLVGNVANMAGDIPRLVDGQGAGRAGRTRAVETRRDRGDIEPVPAIEIAEKAPHRRQMLGARDAAPACHLPVPPARP